MEQLFILPVSDYEQAKKWEVRTTERRGKGIPMISLYNVDKKDFDHLLVLIFDAPDKEWLRCISAHRTDKSKEDLYDMLLPQKLKDQYAFKTDKALSILNFCGVKYI